MSSASCVFIHASDTGHAEGVLIATSRGRKVEFPSEGNASFLRAYKSEEMNLGKGVQSQRCFCRQTLMP